MSPDSSMLGQRVTGTLVLVDDEAGFREGTAQLLRRAGYACWTACDTVEFRVLLCERACDLIIADIDMPGNSRLELVDELSARDDGPPLLLVTSHPSIETATKAIQSRVAGYLTKPLDERNLLEIVRREVDAEQARQLIRRRRSRLEAVLADLCDLESNVRSGRHCPAQEMVNLYLLMLTEHVSTALQDLRLLVAAIVAREGDEESRRRLEGTRPYLLFDALREAIAVLERTKKSFKSKELADLRAKLEALLDCAGATASRSSG
jgi:FixJ family two-component response regulator